MFSRRVSLPPLEKHVGLADHMYSATESSPASARSATPPGSGSRSGGRTPGPTQGDLGYVRFAITGIPGEKHAILIPDDLSFSPALLDQICSALCVEPPDMVLSGVSSLDHPSALSTPGLRACADFAQLMGEARDSISGSGRRSYWEYLTSLRPGAGSGASTDPAPAEAEEQHARTKAQGRALQEFADRVLESKVEAAVTGIATACAEANAWIYVGPVISNFEVLLQRSISNEATEVFTVATAHLQDKAYMEARLSKKLMRMLVANAKPLSNQTVDEALPVILPGELWDPKRKGVDPEFARLGFSSWSCEKVQPEKPSNHPMYQWPWPWADLLLLSYRRKDAAQCYFRSDEVDWVYTTERRLDGEEAPNLSSLAVPGHVFLCGSTAAKKKLLQEVSAGRPTVIVTNTPGITKQMSLLVAVVKGALGQGPTDTWRGLLQDGAWRQLPSTPTGSQIIRSLSSAKLLKYIEGDYDHSGVEPAARLSLSDIVGLLDIAIRSPQVFRETVSVVDPLRDSPESIANRLSSAFWCCYTQTLSGSSKEITSNLALKGWRLHSRLARSNIRLGRLSTLLSVSTALTLVLSTILALCLMYFQLLRSRKMTSLLYAGTPEGLTDSQTLSTLRFCMLALPLTASLLTTCQSHFHFTPRWAVVYMAQHQVVAEIFLFLGGAGRYSPASCMDVAFSVDVDGEAAASASCEVFLRRLQDIMAHLSTSGILSSSGVSEDSLEGDAGDEDFSAESSALQLHVSRTIYAYGEVPVSKERGWDLMSPLTAEGYRELRVAPLMKYYSQLAKYVARRHMALKIIIFLLWGASCALALRDDSLWIPACVSFVGFFTAVLQWTAPQESVDAMKKAFDILSSMDVLWYGANLREKRMESMRRYMVARTERAVLETAAALSRYPQGLFDLDAFES